MVTLLSFLRLNKKFGIRQHKTCPESFKHQSKVWIHTLHKVIIKILIYAIFQLILVFVPFVSAFDLWLRCWCGVVIFIHSEGWWCFLLSDRHKKQIWKKIVRTRNKWIKSHVMNSNLNTMVMEVFSPIYITVHH